MFYSDNLTNRERMITAMPLTNLSKNQWNTLLKYIDRLENNEQTNKMLLSTLKVLRTNQARIEVMSDYYDYYGSELDLPVRDEIVSGFQIM